MAHLNTGVLRCHGIDPITPELTHIKHVGFINGTKLTPALFGQIKGHPCNAVDLRAGVSHGVEASLFPIGLNATLWLTEIDPAGEFADHHQINPFNHLRSKGAGIDQRRHDFDRPEVGKQFHAGPQCQEA